MTELSVRAKAYNGARPTFSEAPDRANETERDVLERFKRDGQFSGETAVCDPAEVTEAASEIMLGRMEPQRFARSLPREIWVTAKYRDERGVLRKKVAFSVALQHEYPPEILTQLDRQLARLNCTLALNKRLFDGGSLPLRWRIARLARRKLGR